VPSVKGNQVEAVGCVCAFNLNATAQDYRIKTPAVRICNWRLAHRVRWVFGVPRSPTPNA